MKALLCVLAAAAAFQAARAAPEVDPPERAAQVMAQAKAAAGGPRLDRVTTFYNSGKRVRDGKIDGTYEEWGDYRTMAFFNRETFNGVTSTGGYTGKVGWRLDSEGRAHVIDVPAQLIGTKLSGYLDVQGYFFPERFPAQFAYGGTREVGGHRYHVVVVTPQGGIPLDLWFDARTHLLRSLDGKMGPVSIHGDILEYQRVNGLEIARHALQTTTTPSGAHTETQNVDTYRFEPIPAEKLEVPGS